MLVALLIAAVSSGCIASSRRCPSPWWTWSLHARPQWHGLALDSGGFASQSWRQCSFVPCMPVIELCRMAPGWERQCPVSTVCSHHTPATFVAVRVRQRCTDCTGWLGAACQTQKMKYYEHQDRVLVDESAEWWQRQVWWERNYPWTGHTASGQADGMPNVVR